MRRQETLYQIAEMEFLQYERDIKEQTLMFVID
jgi:hypothetical protein